MRYVNFLGAAGKIELVKDVIVRLAKTLNHAMGSVGDYFHWTPLPVSEYTRELLVTSVGVSD